MLDRVDAEHLTRLRAVRGAARERAWAAGGAHPGSTPTGDLDRIRRKMAFLVTSGVPERAAQMAMLAAGRFTVGSVLEEQSDLSSDDGADLTADLPAIDHDSAFEAGLRFFLDGLAHPIRA